MVPTNSQVILKIDQSDSSPEVELISLGPLGSGNKLSGVRVWHRIPFFYNLEWFNFKRNHSTVNGKELAVFIEISDAGKLIKFINSMIKMVDSCGIFDEDHSSSSSFNTPEIFFFITETELKLKNGQTSLKFTLPVRWFDSGWAGATITFPPVSIPRVCIKLVAGLDQLAAILKRADSWKNDWSVDCLSISVLAGAVEGLWDVMFVAETSNPPHVRLSTSLPNCPEHQLNKSRVYKPTRVNVNLNAATRALLVPLAENAKLTGSSTAISLACLQDEAIICNVNWNAIEPGVSISTTILIPALI